MSDLRCAECRAVDTACDHVPTEPCRCGSEKHPVSTWDTYVALYGRPTCHAPTRLGGCAARPTGGDEGKG
jgi:hypothetical protein